MQVLDTLAIGHPIISGPLALYPLYTNAPRARDYVPGPIAASRGLLQVDEADGGQVPSLDASISGAAPILMVEGETFVGGLQNRVLNVTVLLASGSSRIPVTCVEAHRWGGGTSMARSESSAPRRLRRIKNETVQRSVQRDGSRCADQGAVWSAIDRLLTSEAVDAPTAALHSAFESRDDAGSGRFANAMRAADELARAGPLPGQTGVVVAAGGRCLAAELFDRPETLQAYWRQIVTSYALDLPTHDAAPPSVSRALRFLRRVRRAEHTAVPGIGLGTEHHWSSDRVIAHGLECDDALVHLSVLAV